MKRKTIFLLYRVLQTIGSPVIVIYLLARGFGNPRWLATLRQRLGLLPSGWQQTVSGAIWFHAVSVGEVLACRPLIDDIRRRCPHTPLFLSTGTLAGFDTARGRLESAGCHVFYAPFDFAWAVRRVLRRLRPSLVVIIETEIWPNLFREVARLNCGLAIVNGRISDRALPRYRRLAWFFSTVFGLCDRILTQSAPMAARFAEAGAASERVTAGRNLKYDFNPGAGPPDSLRAFLDGGAGRPLWIAASTSADDRIAEEDFVIQAQRMLPNWRVIIAPRKPERFDEAARKLDAAGLRYARRSMLTDSSAPILLLDSLGELSALFAYAAVVFMGGTLADRGGHNILEPAAFGKPVIVGPHLENFQEIEQEFAGRNALCRIRSGAELADAVLACAADRALGERAREAALSQRGGAAHAAAALMELYETKYPVVRHPQPLHAFLWTLAQAWRLGSAIDRRRKSNHVRRLPVPVVSIGNITTGGTGKTPMTIELLRDFSASKPALLTRGYGRETSDVVILSSDARVSASRTGDEPYLCHRGARAPVGVGPDRYTTGELLLRESGARMIFLDDGFQHVQLDRDFDLVMVDALNPFGNNGLIPLGRLREPLPGLVRAHAFVITRTREALNLAAIEHTLRQHNSQAPIFHARVVARHWVDREGSSLPAAALNGVPAVAFCGIGNPESFWRTLGHAGVIVLDRHAWDDHHRYTPAEIRRLATHAVDIGAKTLVTTAKDAVNIDPDYAAIVAPPLKLYWLEIGFEIDRRAELVGLIRSRLREHVSKPEQAHRPNLR